MTIDNVLAGALLAPAPFNGHADKLALYGFLVGSWAIEATTQTEPGKFVDRRGELHCGWILGGRVIQEVWNLPGFYYGTLLRIYDPWIDAWHLLWIEPEDQYYPHLIGSACGRDIVQLGKDKYGRDMRWSFTDIASDSFRWIGELKNDDGTWFRQRDIRARRVQT